MGTKVHSKSYLPGYFSMRDLNEDSSSSNWPPFYREKTATSGQYFNGFMPGTTVDDYPGYDKDALKQKMLEHETVFRNQVYELHRLYRIQRDMMKEVKRKDLHEQQGFAEPSSSSNLQGSQMPSEDAKKWHMAGFPLSNSGLGRTTILGVEIVNSPMSGTKGNNTRPSQFPLRNGSSSNVCEALDSRPLKVRKKLFDLQLPAEEYADTEEGKSLPVYKVSNMTSYAPDQNPKTAPISMNLIIGNCADVKVDCRMNTSASSSCFRGSMGLADLNEPLKIEESTAPSPCNFHGQTYINGETKEMNPSKSSTRYFGAAHDGFLINSSVESDVNERRWLSHASEAGYSKSNLNYSSQDSRQDKFLMHSHLVQGTLNHVDRSFGISTTGCCGKDVQRDSSYRDKEFSDRNHNHSHNYQSQSLVASQTVGSSPFFTSPCFTSSWAHSVSSWQKSLNGFTKKTSQCDMPFISSVEMDRYRGPFGEKWQVDASARLNPTLGSEGKTVNGFFHGSASGTRKPQVQLMSAGFDYLNCGRSDEVAPDCSSNQVFGILAKGSCHADSKPALNINLNEVVSSLSNEPLILEDLNTIDGKRKPENQLSAFPWLRPKSVPGIEVNSSYLQASSTHFLCNRETVQDLNQPITPEVLLGSSGCQIIGKKDSVVTDNVKKILGFPIFEPVEPKEEPSPLVSSSTILDFPPEKKQTDNQRKNKFIDINLACEPEEQISDEELVVKKQTKSLYYIDLNSCVSDCEDPPAPSSESKSGGIKVTLDIDLETPVFLDSEGDDTPFDENKTEQIRDEAVRNAADVIFSISSSCLQIPFEDSVIHPSEASLADSLLWFVDAMPSCAVELASKSADESKARDWSQQQDFSGEMDEFEAMTLQLVDTKGENSMHKHFFSEVRIEDGEGAKNSVTRPRRGQSRRGRPRRDFQRDILPGLTSLSRHEVTEDLQTFGGMLRATGHHWNSGLTRRNGGRNGGARGRKRASLETVAISIASAVCTSSVQLTNNIEAGLDDRSLTGWGKTTRRPRRQRCPAGNPPTGALT